MRHRDDKRRARRGGDIDFVEDMVENLGFVVERCEGQKG